MYIVISLINEVKDERFSVKYSGRKNLNRESPNQLNLIVFYFVSTKWQAGEMSDYTNPQIGFFIYDLETKERRQFPRPAKVPW